jgi:hypothetical protein
MILTRKCLVTRKCHDGLQREVSGQGFEWLPHRTPGTPIHANS